MNITHAKSEKVEGDLFLSIFNRQQELMNKYHDIELKSGLMQTEDCPLNLDDKRAQARIKDFSWRVTEEIGEALDAINKENDLDHFIEELVDGLHFLTELSILVNFYPKDITNLTHGDYLKSLIAEVKGLNIYSNIDVKSVKRGLLLVNFIEDLGMMCNCLKNKAWKQTQMKTNKDNFYIHLKKVWRDYFAILLTEDLTAEEITDYYLKKSQVNKFRQRSNY